MKYHVTFYYLASGMEGHADKRDYGIVDAASADAAKSKVIGTEFPDADDASKSFILGCLTAKPVANKAAPVGELREAFEKKYPVAKSLVFCAGRYDAKTDSSQWRHTVCAAINQAWEDYQAGAAYQRQSGVVMPELAECWKLADQLANGSHLDEAQNHDDDSLSELSRRLPFHRRLRAQAERAEKLVKLLTRLNGGSHE